MLVSSSVEEPVSSMDAACSVEQRAISCEDRESCCEAFAICEDDFRKVSETSNNGRDMELLTKMINSRLTPKAHTMIMMTAIIKSVTGFENSSVGKTEIIDQLN